DTTPRLALGSRAPPGDGEKTKYRRIGSAASLVVVCFHFTPSRPLDRVTSSGTPEPAQPFQAGGYAATCYASASPPRPRGPCAGSPANRRTALGTPCLALPSSPP